MAKNKSEDEFKKAVAAEVTKQMQLASKVRRALTQDQKDMLDVVAPNKAARGNYEIIEA